MKRIFLHLKKLDWILTLEVVALVVIGLVGIYNSSLGNLFSFKKQIIFFVLGFSLMILFSFFDYRTLKENPYPILAIYFLCLVALLGLFFFAPEIKGTRSWYKLGPISIDPIEFTKIALIILLAKYFSMRHIEMYDFRHILLSGFYVFLPALLIFLQPDLGSVIILLSIWIVVLFISGINMRHSLILLLIFALTLSLGWSFLLKDYQRQRVMNFAFPQQNLLGGGWSQNQAKIAIGSGGIFGKGIGKGLQTEYRFLPEPRTDFIFASLAEQTGLIGVLVLFLIYGLLISRIIKICLEHQTNFPRLLLVGFLALLVSQIFVNVGMNIGILPVIGIPLPFISYGGSGLIALFVGLGIIQSIKIHKN